MRDKTQKSNEPCLEMDIENVFEVVAERIVLTLPRQHILIIHLPDEENVQNHIHLSEKENDQNIE